MDLNFDLDFPPVKYGGRAKSDTRSNFRERMTQALAKNGTIIVGEVGVEWILYLDEQERTHTSRGADLDNYVKLLNDCIKGSSGAIVDDSQIQHLSIHWLPAASTPSFSLRISDPLDDSLRKPLVFCEMENGLWYPFSLARLSKGDHAPAEDFLAGDGLLSAIYNSINRLISLEESLSSSGISEREIRRRIKYISPQLPGFHKSRIVEAGFTLYPIDKVRNLARISS